MNIELPKEYAEALLEFMKEAKIELTSDNINIVVALLVTTGVTTLALSAGVLSAIKEKFPNSELLV